MRFRSFFKTAGGRVAIAALALAVVAPAIAQDVTVPFEIPSTLEQAEADSAPSFARDQSALAASVLGAAMTSDTASDAPEQPAPATSASVNADKLIIRAPDPRHFECVGDADCAIAEGDCNMTIQAVSRRHVDAWRAAQPHPEDKCENKGASLLNAALQNNKPACVNRRCEMQRVSPVR